MNRDEIIRMAEESGGQDQRFTPETGCQGFWIIHIDGLEHFADLVAAEERKRIIKWCKTYIFEPTNHEGDKLVNKAMKSLIKAIEHLDG